MPILERTTPCWNVRHVVTLHINTVFLSTLVQPNTYNKLIITFLYYLIELKIYIFFLFSPVVIVWCSNQAIFTLSRDTLSTNQIRRYIYLYVWIEIVIVLWSQLSNLSAISWREQDTLDQMIMILINQHA
jgi:hypothetical protein